MSVDQSGQGRNIMDSEIALQAPCGICKLPSQYCCPRCNMQYCSLPCYKSPTHMKCSEGLAQDSFTSSLRNERVDEETKKHMLEILKRFNALDVDEEFSLDVEPSSLGFLGELQPKDIEEMSAEELMARIGPDALKRFEKDMKENPQFAEAVAKEWRPWWLPPLPVQDTIVNKSGQDRWPEALEELPLLESISKERPPESLWNNIVELIYIYIYYSRVFVGDLVSNNVELANSYLKISAVLSSQQFAHASVVHALRMAEAAIAMESDTFLSCETKVLLLDDLVYIIGNPKMILSALGDIQRVFERLIKSDRSFFFAAKKIYFYNVWFHDEFIYDPDLVETILTSMKALLSGCREKLLESQTPSKVDISEALSIIAEERLRNKTENNQDI